MDWQPAGDEERAALERIVALLLSLARLAELTACRSPAVRALVLWLLLAAEAAARNLVTIAPARCPFHHAGLSRADAMRLARRLRNLARALDRRAMYAVCRDGIEEAEPASAVLIDILHHIGAPSLVGRPVVPAAMRAALGVACAPDTS